jgi:hypothetical protein
MRYRGIRVRIGERQVAWRGAAAMAMSCLLLGAFLLSAPGCPAQSTDREPPRPRPSALPATKPPLAETYLDIAVTYCCYAKSLWHDAQPGGYWGGGIAEKDGNGAVRGMCNTMLGHALLAHAWKVGWLDRDQRDRLSSCALTREEMLRRVCGCLEHICAHHKSAPAPIDPTWGQSWQSSLWLGAAGVAVFLAWDDVPVDLRQRFAFIVAAEADRISARPPGDFVPGNTRAEENGWDTHALALALALDAQSTRSATWWRALRDYAANTHSVKADRLSTAKLGDENVRDVVRTANFLDDFTLDNHGFFHPDYVQVSGQELGEAWVILALGDARSGTDYARRFEPYAVHHVADVWDRVMSRLLTPNGEFVFPQGNDWTFHCSMYQGYLAWVATSLGDSVAQAAEKAGIRAALDRRQVSPPGRVLGDSNLQWWWEPLLVKRCTGALLMHALRAGEPARQRIASVSSDVEWTGTWPNAAVWMHRNPWYAVSVSWASHRMGTFTPLGPGFAQAPYMTLPLNGGVLPKGTTTPLESGRLEEVEAIALGLPGKGCCWAIALPRSVVWLSPGGFQPLGIENARLSGSVRTLRAGGGERRFPALEKRPKERIDSSWLSIDNRLGMVTDGGGFEYQAAGAFNRLSVAIDQIAPAAGGRVWQMIPGASGEATEVAARTLKVKDTEGLLEITVLDGDGDGATVYDIAATVGTDWKPAGPGRGLRHLSIRHHTNNQKEKP